MNRHISKPVALAFAAALTVPWALPGAAETTQTGDDENLVEEVFVVGKRRAYRGNFDNLEKPSADQLIEEALLREAGAINLNDALDLSASVARQNNFGGLWNAFSVRGFSGDINLPSGFLVNGFNAGRGFAGPRDLSGIESVEVLKGPRSALFGRGEPGGTVNLITKRPQFETAGEFRATYGRWEQMRFEGDVQTTAGTSDALGLRLVGFYEDAESFRDTVETERVGFYPSIAWRISDATSVTYEMEYTEQEIPFDRGVAYSESHGFTPRKTFVGEPGDGPIETEVLGHQLEVQHNFSDNWSLLAGLGYRDTSFEGNCIRNQLRRTPDLFPGRPDAVTFFPLSELRIGLPRSPRRSCRRVRIRARFATGCWWAPTTTNSNSTGSSSVTGPGGFHRTRTSIRSIPRNISSWTSLIQSTASLHNRCPGPTPTGTKTWKDSASTSRTRSTSPIGCRFAWACAGMTLNRT